MNRTHSGTMIAWRTHNARKTKRAETWCADYGLKPIYKALHIGSLYANERAALNRKLKSLLAGKRDSYVMLVLCISCLKGFNSTHEITNIETPYEIV